MTDWRSLLTAEPDDDVARLNEELRAAVAAQPPVDTIDPVVYREASDAYARATRTQYDWAEERVVPLPTGPLPMRLLVPERVTGVYLFIHGGGWMTGARDLSDEILWPRAQQAEVAVASIDYRLAPESRWPAAGDDCEAAALWLADNAVREFGTDRIVVGGDSAGAHLSVVTALRLRDRHGRTPFCGLDLRYGLYDLRLTPSARRAAGKPLDADALRWILRHAFDEDVRDTPDASPLLADVAGLPPALFTVGTADSLLDDSLFMWMRWLAAGNEARLALHPGCPHAFDYFPLAAAARAVDDSVAFIRACVAAPPDDRSVHLQQLKVN